MNKSEDGYIGTDAAAKALGISPDTIRTYLGRIVIALALIVFVQVTSFLLFVVLPYQREQRIAEKIRSKKVCSVKWTDDMPTWVPTPVRDRLPFWRRISTILFLQTQVTDVELEQLKRLTSLEMLQLDHTRQGDAGLERLKGLTSLRWLWLSDKTVTDKGLEHLKGLMSLNYLVLSNTQTTPEGVDMLRRALPNCKIYTESTKDVRLRCGLKLSLEFVP